MNKFSKVLFIISFIVLAFIHTSTRSYAAEFMPNEVKAINNRTIGVYFAPEEIKIYASPDEKSELIELIRWNAHGVQAIPQELSSFEAFLAFVPTKKYALLPVTSENDNEDWVEITYNKKTGAKGWVKLQSTESFKTWLEFMHTLGKENRLYFLSDIPEKYKSLRTGPDDESQLVTNNDYIATQEIELTYISGNWMLVKEIDYNKTVQIGWIRWRDSDGNTFVFPKLGSD